MSWYFAILVVGGLALAIVTTIDIAWGDLPLWAGYTIAGLIGAAAGLFVATRGP